MKARATGGFVRAWDIPRDRELGGQGLLEGDRLFTVV